VTLGCGSRTSVDRPFEPASEEDASADAGADGGADAREGADGDDGSVEDEGGYVFCHGQWCSATFPHCVDIAGQWACCNGPGPYNGTTGSCSLSP